MKYCFLNEKIMPFSEAGISLKDIGLLRGYGVFDVSYACNGKVFLFDDHMDRLWRSADKVNISIPYSREEVKKIVNNLMIKNETRSAYVRVLLTGGESKNGIFYDSQKPTFIVLIENPDKIPDKYYKKGASLVTVEHKRDFPDAKTINYTVAVKNLPDVRKRGALDILYTLNNKLMESSTSNFFIVKNKTIATPQKGVLQGVTRKFLLSIAKDHLRTEKRDILISELDDCDEAFITSTSKDVVPVVKIDDKSIGNGSVGETTSFLMRLFKKRKEEALS